jgi:hypothetical protein
MVVPKGIRVTKQGKTDRNSRIARLMSPAPLDRFRRGPSVRIGRGLPKTYCSLFGGNANAVRFTLAGALVTGFHGTWFAVRSQ